MDKNGNIVTSGGNLLEPQITIPAQAQNITIATDGTVSYTQPVKPPPSSRDRSSLLTFRIPPVSTQSAAIFLWLLMLPDNRRSLTPGDRKVSVRCLQGYQEQSNVSVVQEFINLIAAQRGYEANSKVVKAADEMYQAVNNIAQ